MSGAQLFDLISLDDNVLKAGLQPTVPITMEAWIRPSSYPWEWMTTCHFKNDKPFFGIFESKLDYWREDKEVRGTAVVPFSQWSHAAVTHAEPPRICTSTVRWTSRATSPSRT